MGEVRPENHKYLHPFQRSYFGLPQFRHRLFLLTQQLPRLLTKATSILHTKKHFLLLCSSTPCIHLLTSSINPPPQCLPSTTKVLRRLHIRLALDHHRIDRYLKYQKSNRQMSLIASKSSTPTPSTCLRTQYFDHIYNYTLAPRSHGRAMSDVALYSHPGKGEAPPCPRSKVLAAGQPASASPPIMTSLSVF